MQLAIQALVVWENLKASAHDRWHDQTGEGVISTAIAVLIMAIIGLAMWKSFSAVFKTASDQVDVKVNDIGK
ncbi:MAG: hypothetical protein JWM47_1970 [Acidimicrobiales bacterium]|nr:hypothetical protein [Acidimicrobiales bacterium]